MPSEPFKEIFRVGQIPVEKHRHFASHVERAVDRHRRRRGRSKDLEAIEQQLRELERGAKAARALADRKIWRPSEYKKRLREIGRLLHELPPEAHELLALRDVIILPQPPLEDADIFCDHRAVVDPSAFDDFGEQLLALEYLYGALAGPLSGGTVGNNHQYEKYILFFDIALSYSLATKKRGDDHDATFMDMLQEIRLAYGLDDWSPESVARQARRWRAELRRQNED